MLGLTVTDILKKAAHSDINQRLETPLTVRVCSLSNTTQRDHATASNIGTSKRMRSDEANWLKMSTEVLLAMDKLNTEV